jgi:hypothetical protein
VRKPAPVILLGARIINGDKRAHTTAGKDGDPVSFVLLDIMYIIGAPESW